MKNAAIPKPGYTDKQTAWRALRLIKISILILSLGLTFVGKRKAGWPIVSWALYSEYSARFRPPEPVAIDTELRIYTTTGDMYVVKPEHVLTVPRDSLSHKIIEHSFNEDNVTLRNSSRQYLANALLSQLPQHSEIEAVELWEISYQVEPLSVPPFQAQSPASRVMLGSFSTKELAQIN